MRKATLRRLEALEKREQQELSSLKQARMYAWVIVIAYYLGDLESSTPSSSSAPGTAQPRTIFRFVESLDDPFEAFARDDPREAFARALQYSSVDDLVNSVIKGNTSLDDRNTAAYRRLFKTVGPDFETTRLSVLFDAFTAMVNRLPDQWLNWLRSNLQQYCANLEIAAGSNLPRRLSDENFLPYPRVRFSSLTGRRRAGGAQPNSNRHDRTLRKSRVFTQISNPAGGDRRYAIGSPADRRKPSNARFRHS